MAECLVKLDGSNGACCWCQGVVGSAGWLKEIQRIPLMPEHYPGGLGGGMYGGDGGGGGMHGGGGGVCVCFYVLLICMHIHT